MNAAAVDVEEATSGQVPAIRETIEQVCEQRDLALQLTEQAMRLLLQAEEAACRAAPTDDHAGFLGSLDLRGFGWSPASAEGRLAAIMEEARLRIDSCAWLDLQKRTGLRSLLDAQGMKEFREQMGGDKTPPFTVDNATATFLTAASNLDQIFTRSIVNVFESLPKAKLVSNSAFGFGKRVIWPNAFSGWWGWNHYGNAQALVRDLDRVMHVLAGKRPPDMGGDFADLVGKTRTDRKKGERATECENEFLHARCYSTSLHLTFKRADLVQMANDNLRRHYGATIPDNRKER